METEYIYRVLLKQLQHGEDTESSWLQMYIYVNIFKVWINEYQTKVGFWGCSYYIRPCFTAFVPYPILFYTGMQLVYKSLAACRFR